MTSSFYYHTTEFDPETFAQKCARQFDNIPNEISTVELLEKVPVEPDEFFISQFTKGWKAANYSENSVEFDVSYEDLNEESREQELEYLRKGFGQFFVTTVQMQAGDKPFTCSALIEIRGRVRGGETEYYIQELIEGQPDL